MCPMNHSATAPLFVPFMSRIEATVSPGDKTGQVRFVPFAVPNIRCCPLPRGGLRHRHPHDSLAFPGAGAASSQAAEASRWVAVADPDELALVDWLPVMRPDASRYWVFVAEPVPVRVSALPAKRPLASR